jgi:PAS domain S-box-containing protein
MPEVHFFPWFFAALVIVSAMWIGLRIGRSFHSRGQQKHSDDHALLCAAFFDQMRDAALVTEHGRVVEANRAAAELFGYDRETLLGLPAQDLLAEAASAGAFLRALRKGAVVDYEIRLRTAKGDVRECLVTAIAHFDHTHRVIGSRGLARDVTERNRMVAELRSAERDYRGLFENAHDAILILEPETEVVLDANRQACILYGFPREEFLGRSMLELSVHAERARTLWDTERSSSSFATFESQHLRRDGQVIDVEITAGDAWYSGRRVILSINRNVTARAESEKARRELLDTLHDVANEWTATFDAVQVPVVMLDATGEIRRLNRAAQTLAGRSFDRLIQTPADALPGEPWRSIAAVAREAFRGNMQSIRATEGESVWQVSTAITGTPDAGRAIVVAYDLTLVTQLEASVRRNEVAAALGSLVAGVAHEVRNPLFTISATLDAWEARYGRTEGIERYAVSLREQVDRLNRLMRDLLEYGKPNPLVFADASLSNVIRSASADCAALASQQGVRIVHELADLPSVPIDAGRMEQAVLNVIDNAIRHSPEGAAVRIVSAVEGGQIVCRVMDDGPGLGAQDPETLFVPMYTRRRGGTGLGLPIARNIVTAHGGTITVASRVDGSGAMATIRVPIEREAPQERRTA